MSPLATLLSRGKEMQADDGDVADLGTTRVHVDARVNLLPPEIAEAERFRREQVVRGAAVLAALAVVGGLYVTAAGGVSSAQSEVDSATQRSTELSREVAALADVPATALALQTAQGQRTGALGNEVRWAEYLNNLGILTPASIQLESLSITQSVDAPAAAAAPGSATGPVSATGTPGIATVTFAGIAKSNDAVAFFLDSLAKQKGNVDPYFSSAKAAEDDRSKRDVVTFDATVTVNDEAKSGRYSTSGG